MLHPEAKPNGAHQALAAMEAAGKLYDVTRLDHFRGFESYWAVPYGDETARNGHWVKGPGIGFIRAIQKASPKTKIILQSIFPVTAGCVNLDNGKIDTANKWVKAVAKDCGCYYLDRFALADINLTYYEVVRIFVRNNRENYCNSSDGIHMGKEAYVAILEYIRTHAITD